MSSTADRTRILPQLSVRRGRAAVAFYKAAFGAVEDYRVGGTDDSEDVVAQLSVGDASFWVADESPPHRNFTTLPDGRMAVDIHQTVRGLDGQVLGEGRVCHVYALRDGLVTRMDVEELGEGS